ncbi:MAG: NADH-quinone oxidoreductase subunit N [Aggregatilineales bacterium]
MPGLTIVPNTDGLANVVAVLPELLLTVLAVAIVLLDAFWPESRRRQLGYIAAFGAFAVAAVTLLLTPPGSNAQFVLGGMIRDDGLSQLFRVIVIIGAGLASLISMDSPGIGRRGEFYAVLLVATIGTCFMSSAADLIMVFIALETTSISLYILAGFLRNNARSTEAGMKYFLFGAFTSAIMLYGFSLLYGFTKQTNLYAIGDVLRSTFPAGAPINVGTLLPILLALVMIAVGFGFKISAVPFHFWTPDVYEGAPTSVTAFISVASKAASFALLTRFFLVAFQGDVTTHFWVQMLAVLAVVTMTTGNLLALPQRNIKRLLAYSSIAQAGYTLIGVAAIAAQPGSAAGAGAAAVGFYMAMYTLTNLAAFGVVILFANATGSETIADFAGLSRRNLGLTLAMTIALLSLGGIPPAAGFVGKFFLFRAAVDSNLTWLAVIGVLNSIVALYYYLVIIKVMFVDRSEDENKEIAVSSPYRWALLLACFGVVALGVFAGPVFDWAASAAQGLFS